MTWTQQKSKGKETTKIRLRVSNWISGRGLDLGCGIDKISPDTLGIDLLPLPGIDFLLDIRDLYIFKDAEMDYIFSSHALEDLQDTDNVLREWWRLIKPNAHLILYLPHKDLYPNIGQPGSNPAHKHDFEAKDVLDVLSRFARFKILINEIRSKDNEYSFLLVLRKKK